MIDVAGRDCPCHQAMLELLPYFECIAEIVMKRKLSLARFCVFFVLTLSGTSALRAEGGWFLPAPLPFPFGPPTQASYGPTNHSASRPIPQSFQSIEVDFQNLTQDAVSLHANGRVIAEVPAGIGCRFFVPAGRVSLRATLMPSGIERTLDVYETRSFGWKLRVEQNASLPIQAPSPLEVNDERQVQRPVPAPRFQNPPDTRPVRVMITPRPASERPWVRES